MWASGRTIRRMARAPISTRMATAIQVMRANNPLNQLNVVSCLIILIIIIIITATIMIITIVMNIITTIISIIIITNKSIILYVHVRE